VRGKEINGQKFKEDTRIENLSVTGGYLHLSREVQQGAGLFVVIWLSGSAGLALRGIVQRVQALPNGKWGVSIMIKRYRLF